MKTTKFLAGFLFAAALTASSSVFAQVKIGNNPATINSSAVLDVESTNKGFLPPRVALQSVSDATTIANPATGLLVYNTNAGITGGSGTGIYINAGTPAAPDWGKLLAATSTSGLTADKMIYGGVVDPGKVVQGGILEFRYTPLSSGVYNLEARLISQPANPVTIKGERLGWFGSLSSVANVTVNTSWNTVDWNQWKAIDGVGTGVGHLYYLDVSNDTKFYRISASIQDTRFALAIETF